MALPGEPVEGKWLVLEELTNLSDSHIHVPAIRITVNHARIHNPICRSGGVDWSTHKEKARSANDVATHQMSFEVLIKRPSAWLLLIDLPCSCIWAYCSTLCIICKLDFVHG